MKAFEGWPLWAATLLLSGILVLGIYLADTLRTVLPLVGAIVLDAVLAGLYLHEYSQRPLAEPPVPAAPGSVGRSLAPGAAGVATVPPVAEPPYSSAPELTEEGEFDDPVIEADRIDSGLESAEGEPKPTARGEGAPPG